MKMNLQVKRYAIVWFCFFLAWSCQEKTERSVYPGFYHWKTELNLSASEFEYLKAVSATQIYLRFFDVDWNESSGMPLPVAVLEPNSDIPPSVNIIPTVFITNRTFQKNEREEIPQFVENVIKKLNTIAGKFPAHEISEIQMDCDWSESTREKYFEFLERLRSKLAKQDVRLSATIRLHQIKYFKKTGVPPVDRGVLMFYNMGDLEDPATENSILDLSVAKRYFENFDNYPLKLDVALPLFSWGVLFREGRMVQLMNQLGETDLQDESRFLKIEENRFELLKSTYLKGHYLYEGDQIRLEFISGALLQKTADLLSPLVQNQELNVIFYHLDSTIVKTYPHEVLEDICHRFR